LSGQIPGHLTPPGSVSFTATKYIMCDRSRDTSHIWHKRAIVIVIKEACSALCWNIILCGLIIRYAWFMLNGGTSCYLSPTRHIRSVATCQLGFEMLHLKSMQYFSFQWGNSFKIIQSHMTRSRPIVFQILTLKYVTYEIIKRSREALLASRASNSNG